MREVRGINMSKLKSLLGILKESDDREEEMLLTEDEFGELAALRDEAHDQLRVLKDALLKTRNEHFNDKVRLKKIDHFISLYNGIEEKLVELKEELGDTI